MFGSDMRAVTTGRTASTRRAWSAIAVALLTAGSVFLTSSIASAAPVTVDAKRYALLEPTDGTVITAFNDSSLGGFNFSISSAREQSDGKIVIIGAIQFYNGVQIPYGVARLNAEGTRDTTFNAGVGKTGTGGAPMTLAIQSDDKILVGGGVVTYNGTSVGPGIVRLNSDGTLDTTFNVGGAGFAQVGGTNAPQIYEINVLSNGQILVGGYFTSYNGTAASRLVRLNSDGSLDTTLTAGFNERVESTKVLSDGSILVTGWFNTYNGVAAHGIAKISSTGVLDTSFTMGGPANPVAGHPLELNVQPDGKILVIGDIYTWNGDTAGGIVRLNSDGTTDTSFN